MRDLLSELPVHRASEPIGEAAVVLRGFALARAGELMDAVERIDAAAPFRHLTTPGGQSWRFLAEGADIDVEESIFFADPICLRRTLQIVLKGPCSKATSVNWKFERITQQRPVLLDSNPRRAS